MMMLLHIIAGCLLCLAYNVEVFVKWLHFMFCRFTYLLKFIKGMMLNLVLQQPFYKYIVSCCLLNINDLLKFIKNLKNIFENVLQYQKRVVYL